MKVLLAANQLGTRGGSELYVLELASALADRGAKVAIFAFFPGPLSDTFRRRQRISVFGPEDLDDVKRFAPDIIHTHHLTTFHLMGEALPGAPRVHGLLGVVPELEQPPVTIGEAARVFAVSERVRDLAIDRSSTAIRVEIIRNWFDERQLIPVPTRMRADNIRHRILVVSNNSCGDRDRALRELEDDGFASVARVGTPTRQREVTAELLQTYDVVITIGRTVLLAAAVGVPCIVADLQLSDGLLTHDIVDELAPFNFSGRTYRKAITADHLRSEILRSKRIDREALSKKMRAEYGLSARARHILSVYETVLAEDQERPAISPTFRRGEGMAYLDLAIRIRRMEALRSGWFPLRAARRRLSRIWRSVGHRWRLRR